MAAINNGADLVFDLQGHLLVSIGDVDENTPHVSSSASGWSVFLLLAPFIVAYAAAAVAAWEMGPGRVEPTTPPVAEGSAP